MLNYKPFYKTIMLEATAPMDGGILYFLGGYFVRLVRMFLLLSVWKSIFSYRGELATVQCRTILLYTLLASAFYQQLDVQTTASTTLWEGTVSSRFLRPINVFGQYISETIGRWLPGTIFFTVPVLLMSPVLGVNLMPLKVLLIPEGIISLLLAIAIGFAMDFIFTGLMVTLGNMHYHANRIRTSVTVLLSGVIVPLYILPWNLGSILEWLPFASMASAPLQIYTGTGNVIRLLFLQSVWCVILWIIAEVVWRSNRQRLVIYGG